MAEYELTKSLEPREYQKAIAKAAAEKNTLVVLPTGMGKTLIAVMVGIERLNRHPGSKILITSPTRPLNAQHKKSFEDFTNVPKDEIVLITGKLSPAQRERTYKQATIIAATPQCIRNDLESGRLSLADFSFVIIDEAHRAVRGYAYTSIAKKYMLQAGHPLVLGLTASPGATPQKIREICDNLFIKAVEVRSEADGDVQPYVKEIERDWAYVDMPAEFGKIKELLAERLKESVWWLKEHHYIFTYKPSKSMLLAVQARVGAGYDRGSKSFGNIWAMIRAAEAIKLEHAIELLETQGIPFLHDYFEKMRASKKRTDQRLAKDERVQKAIEIVGTLHAAGVEHPKLTKVKNIVKDFVTKPDAAKNAKNAKNVKNVKIIVFANYRATVEKIKDMLEGEGIAAKEFIGQANKEGKGMKQEEQIRILRDFREGRFNVLVSTSIGEEGLDVPSVDYAVFYEPVPSAIRMIQRRGRVGRQMAGKVIFMITKGTRDEAYYWAAFHKEKRMRGILYDLQRGKRLDKKKTLLDWTKEDK